MPCFMLLSTLLLLQNSNCCTILVVLCYGFHFPQYCSFNFLIFAFSLFPNHWADQPTSSHNGVVLLPWKQSRFCLWTFCVLTEIGQDLIMRSLSIIRFMVFKLILINQNCILNFPRLPFKKNTATNIRLYRCFFYTLNNSNLFLCLQLSKISDILFYKLLSARDLMLKIFYC